jgi:hypothetical protein
MLQEAIESARIKIEISFFISFKIDLGILPFQSVDAKNMERLRRKIKKSRLLSGF